MMSDTDHHAFDLVLAYPQWQGSARSANLPRGASAAAAVCAHYGRAFARVPDAGEGEDAGGIRRWTAILEQFRAAQALLAQHRPARVLAAGGDCGCDVAVIDYLHRRHPDLGVLWVDAHLDANTVATTPSGSFHGMPVAALLGSPPADLMPLLGEPLPPSRFRYVGAHIGDDGDWAFQREHSLAWIEPAVAMDGPVHVHFDLDALEPSQFPHVAYPDGRLSIDDGVALVRTAAARGTLVGLTITEFAPVDAAAAQDGAAVIERICEAARV
jgi:arginase